VKTNIKIDLVSMMDKILLVLTSLFFFNCVFDPAGLFFGIKTMLFVFIMITLAFKAFVSKKLYIPKNILSFILIFAFLIPILSLISTIIFHQFKNNTIQLVYGTINTGLFLLIIFVFFNSSYNYLKIFIFWLTILSSLIIILHFIVINNTSLIPNLQKFGVKYRIFQFAVGPLLGTTIVRVYFWASPVLLLAVAYYSYKVIIQPTRVANYFLLFINILGMFFSGSRLNMIISVITFFLILLFYLSSKNLLPILLILIIFICTSLILYFDEISLMFGNNSDSEKFGMINDYKKIYISNIKTFLFGQGIGSEAYFAARGEVMSYTELTYFDLFRKYGFILGLTLLGAIFYPIFLIRTAKSKFLWIIVTYGLYLFMAFFNPFYFSSNGMIILSFTLFLIFQGSHEIINLKLSKNRDEI
jgi:hypothetical protein